MGAQSRYFDFGKWAEDGTGWEHYSADECDECGVALIGSTGEMQHCEADDESECEGYVMFSEPVMNYIWPVDVRRVGDASDAALALAGLPLCIVTVEDMEFLALTGGGMDLSWEIIEGYMRLGYLPPTALIPPPAMAGKTLSRKNRWLLAGCAASVRVTRRSLNSTARNIRALRAAMEREGERQKELAARRKETS